MIHDHDTRTALDHWAMVDLEKATERVDEVLTKIERGRLDYLQRTHDDILREEAEHGGR